jgi:tRNA(Ile)-lysidine synthase TilS/MesJ
LPYLSESCLLPLVNLVPDVFSAPPYNKRPVLIKDKIEIKRKKIVAYLRKRNNKYIPGPNCLNSSIDTKRLNF